MKKILVVEDAENLLRFMRVNLSVEDFSVFSAMSASDGWELALAEHPDLIILDILLPDLAGWELLARFKSHPEMHNIPVLVLSDSTRPEEEERARRLGAGDYLIKPISAGELVRRAKRALGSGPSSPKREESLPS